MDNFGLKTPVQPDGSDLQKQVDQLRLLIMSVLILVIVISGTFNLYLRRQQMSSSKELAATRTMIAEYQKVRGPKIGAFVKQLVDYERSHPDFAPVLAEYGIRPAGPTSTPPAALGSPPAAAPKK